MAYDARNLDHCKAEFTINGKIYQCSAHHVSYEIEYFTTPSTRARNRWYHTAMYTTKGSMNVSPKGELTTDGNPYDNGYLAILI